MRGPRRTKVAHGGAKRSQLPCFAFSPMRRFCVPASNSTSSVDRQSQVETELRTFVGFSNTRDLRSRAYRSLGCRLTIKVCNTRVGTAHRTISTDEPPLVGVCAYGNPSVSPPQGRKGEQSGPELVACLQ